MYCSGQLSYPLFEKIGKQEQVNFKNKVEAEIAKKLRTTQPQQKVASSYLKKRVFPPKLFSNKLRSIILTVNNYATFSQFIQLRRYSAHKTLGQIKNNH